mgnify:CR=1 FL=1
MSKIFCLLGKSSSGKDTIFKKLKEDETLKLKPIIPYTTRPKRDKEIDGVQYYFINEDKLKEYEKDGKIIEERMYNTVNGKWYYCTIDDGQITFETYNYLLITTLEAYKNIRNYFGEDKVIPFYINVEDGARLERAFRRERHQYKPNYEEMCRRFLADSSDFSEEKLRECGIKKYYDNYKLSKCVKEVKKDILLNM